VIECISIYENYAIITYSFPRNTEGENTARIQFPPEKDGYIRLVIRLEAWGKWKRPNDFIIGPFLCYLINRSTD